MAWYDNYPRPIRDIWGAASEGRPAVVLEGNTNDRILSRQSDLPPMNLTHAIHAVAGRQGYHCGEISVTNGFMAVKPPDSRANGRGFPVAQGHPSENMAAYLAQFFGPLQSRDEPKLLVVNGGDLICPENDPAMLTPDQLRTLSALIELGLSDSFRRSGNVLVVKTLQANVNRALLRSGAFRLVSVPLPAESMRREFSDSLFRLQGYAQPEEDLTLDEFARLTNGCRLIDLEGIARKRQLDGGRISRADIAEIKRQCILDVSQGQLGVIAPSRTMNDVIGCEHIKRFFRYQKQLARDGGRMPTMIIMVGVPGVGKSHTAEAYANELGWTLLEWRNVRSQWVGQSEARTEQALNLIRENSPCLVWVDECDQAIGGRSSGTADGGVDARIFGMILKETGNADIRGKVQWLMASNRPDYLDAAIQDRAGAKLVFLPPSAEDREKLIPHLTRQEQRTLAADADVHALARADNLRMASVRDLIEIVGQASKKADLESGRSNGPIGGGALEQAVRTFKPGDQAETEFIALKCLEHVRFLDQLPWIDEHDRMVAGYDLPPFLDGIVDPETGQVDAHRLAARLRQLELQRARRRSAG